MCASSSSSLLTASESVIHTTSGLVVSSKSSVVSSEKALCLSILDFDFKLLEEVTFNLGDLVVSTFFLHPKLDDDESFLADEGSILMLWLCTCGSKSSSSSVDSSDIINSFKVTLDLPFVAAFFFVFVQVLLCNFSFSLEGVGLLLRMELAPVDASEGESSYLHTGSDFITNRSSSNAPSPIDSDGNGIG